LTFERFGGIRLITTLATPIEDFWQGDEGRIASDREADEAFGAFQVRRLVWSGGHLDCGCEVGHRGISIEHYDALAGE
jgi:hypothetical protein